MEKSLSLGTESIWTTTHHPIQTVACHNLVHRVEALTNRSHLLTDPPNAKGIQMVPADNRVAHVGPFDNHQAQAGPINDRGGTTGLKDNHGTQVGPLNVNGALTAPLRGMAPALATGTA